MSGEPDTENRAIPPIRGTPFTVQVTLDAKAPKKLAW